MSSGVPCERCEAVVNRLEHLEDQVDKIRATQLEIKEYHIKQRGFIGGVIFIITCIGAAATLLINYLGSH